MINLYEKTKCSKCQKEVETIDLFPQNLCVDCYEAEYNKMTEEEKRPNFIKALN